MVLVATEDFYSKLHSLQEDTKKPEDRKDFRNPCQMDYNRLMYHRGKMAWEEILSTFSAILHPNHKAVASHTVKHKNFYCPESK